MYEPQVRILGQPSQYSLLSPKIHRSPKIAVRESIIAESTKTSRVHFKVPPAVSTHRIVPHARLPHPHPLRISQVHRALCIPSECQVIGAKSQEYPLAMAMNTIATAPGDAAWPVCARWYRYRRGSLCSASSGRSKAFPTGRNSNRAGARRYPDSHGRGYF